MDEMATWGDVGSNIFWGDLNGSVTGITTDLYNDYYMLVMSKLVR